MWMFSARKRSKHTQKHHDIDSKEYKTWCGIKRRCTNPKEQSYKNYGAKGIVMSDEWAESYEQFLSDMGRCPKNCSSIDRIDNNKGYEKGNCRWATTIDQCNNRTSNRIVTYRGETDTLANICRKYGVQYGLVHSRLSKGLNIDLAIELPIQQNRRSLKATVEEIIEHFKN